MIRKFNGWLIFISFLSSFSAMANQQPVLEQLQVPVCLAEQIATDFNVLAENKAFKIIEVSLSDIDEISRIADKVRCGRFVNLSQHLKAKSPKERLFLARQQLSQPVIKPIVKAADYGINHQALVNKLIQQVEGKNINDTLIHLTSYINRSALLPTGVNTAKWLKASFEGMAIENGRKDTETFFVKTSDAYIQPSVVYVIGKDIKAPALVIGAHMDTLGQNEKERMPGAGDDGSGSASIMEMARILLSTDVALKRPVYIIWYAAEERGLVGSQQVVEHFLKNNIPVYAALQFDMTGYRSKKDDKTMWVYQDYTDKSLSDFLASLIKTYVKVPVDYSKCGYGCSDHASWMAAGIPAAFPCETSFEAHNPYIHSPSDTMDLLSREHMENFTKLGLALVGELAAA